jgi:ADP-ribose pyrophosphatase
LNKEYKGTILNQEFVGKNLRARIELVKYGEKDVLFDVISYPNSTAILPIKSNGKAILERHYRHAIKETILEVPAGKLRDGERPEDGAKRELLEETGYKSMSIQNLGTIFAAPGYSTERIHLFVSNVRDQPDENQALEPGEEITLEEFDLKELENLVLSGEINDSMTLSLIYLAKLKGIV